ncbi:nucleoside triphosphate pyrophosphatase [Methylomonas sp. DH-1]|uniref:Maf family protein n=1 Tax=Methylomonas sp. (strain DH-1) TaxID=1727196 RepID=UPI0007C95E4A|nr:Maf family protein [Methylomonas sp. DH-1]ANE54890.1 septum formation inhibitor Maf [Methylomonas sp. DH-1]
MTDKRPIVLASGSAYRRELLKKLAIDFSCCPADVDETPLPNEAPAELALRLSVEKALAVGRSHPAHWVIGSDQVAAFDGEILGKPGNRERALAQLQSQSGKAVSFYTGLCLLDSASGQYYTALDRCEVHFKPLSRQQIEYYLDMDRPYDCAGSFKAEALGIALFDKICGEDPNALVGLPLIKLAGLLQQFGLDVLQPAAD